MTMIQDRLTTVADMPPSASAPTMMRVLKRNGNLEPVDVNKIVNAVARAAEGLLGVDPLTVSTRTIAALADGATTRELDELSIRTAAGLIVEEPNYSKLAARMLATYIDKEVRNQNIPWFSEAMEAGRELGLISEDTVEFVRANSPALNAAVDSGPRPQLRVLRPAHRVRPLPAAPPRHPPGDRDSAVLLPASRLRAEHRRRRGHPLLRPDLVSGLPAVEPHPVQLGHDAPADVELLPAGFSRGLPGGHLPALHRHRAALEVRGRHRRGLAPHPLQGIADPGHQRAVQRHRPLAQDPRLLSGRRQPGRPAQGRGVRLPGDMARRHRAVPGAA